MDIASVIGLIAAWALFFASILVAPGAKLTAFVDYPSLMVVIGGAIAASMMCLPMPIVLGVPKYLLKAIFPKQESIAPIITQLVQFAEVARRDGILALESKTGEIKDPFLLMGIQMAVDGTDADVMEAVLRTEMDAIAGRHKVAKQALDMIVKYAPAFGMIGTLVGLVIMLGNMDDPAAIGPGMAVALLTTLYGAMIANMLCAPLADKLAYYSKQEYTLKEIIVRGIQSIQAGDNPRVLEQKLKTFLPRNQRGPATEAKAA